MPVFSSRPLFEHLLDAVNGVIRGKTDVVRQAVITLLAGGHLLLEDVPGVGKTTMARALARAMGGTFRRVQFTSDLLPADILGVNVFDPAVRTFHFRPGPIFCHVLLADEINRTTPRTQSALLQSMEEHQVTLDGTTHPLEEPFLVIATQNPREHHGTYPLPESQMDRFLMRLSMGYPDPSAEKELVAGLGRPEEALAEMEPVFSPALLMQARRAVRRVQMDETLLDYLLRLVQATREHPDLALGASPRASLALSHAARASACLAGREFVLPDDIKALVPAVLAHRLVPREDGGDPAARLDQVDALLAELLEQTPVPL
ncbi:MAG: AAA family ATPase [Acidobacteriota bacterium]